MPRVYMNIVELADMERGPGQFDTQPVCATHASKDADSSEIDATPLTVYHMPVECEVCGVHIGYIDCTPEVE